MRNRWENILREYFIKNEMWMTFNCTVDEYINQAWNETYQSLSRGISYS